MDKLTYRFEIADPYPSAFEKVIQNFHRTLQDREEEAIEAALKENGYEKVRTCHNAWQYGGGTFQCSECGCLLALDDGYGNTIEFADVPEQGYPNKPKYCAGCGAKVVE